MIEVFTSDFRHQTEAANILNILKNRFEGLKLDFDLTDSKEAYPCGHSILRVEGDFIDVHKIMGTLHETGFRCDILGDKTCNAESEEFWEKNFLEKQEMWGFTPTHSALLAKDLFVEKSIKNVLIPGIGYGRNASVFKDAGIAVTGIETSKTAIELASKHFGTDLVIHHGSVTEMPFDNKLYDSIFCHALIHLLDEAERAKLIRDCYRQLTEGGYMVFTVISKDAPTYGQGTPVGKDRFEVFGGVRLFFYDRASVQAEFGGAGLYEIEEVEENYPFFLIKCRKGGFHVD